MKVKNQTDHKNTKRIQNPKLKNPASKTHNCDVNLIIFFFNWVTLCIPNNDTDIFPLSYAMHHHLFFSITQLFQSFVPTSIKHIACFKMTK